LVYGHLVLALCKQIVLQISAHLARQASAVLLEELAGDEGEVVCFAFVLLVALLIFLQLVVQLFLIVEEQEFVFEDLRAAQARLFVLNVSVGGLAQGMLLRVDAHIAMLLLLYEVLAHLAEVVGEELLVGQTIIEVDAFSETV